MPWCDECSKFWNPNTLPPDGTCPACGRVIADPPETKVPWHFWGLLGALLIYLGWRVVQGFDWLVSNDHLVWAVLGGVALVLVAAAAAAWNWWPSGDSVDKSEHA